MTELIYKDEVFAIVGAAIEVHKTLGSGFLEAVYHEAMEIESTERTLPFASPVKLKIHYKTQELEKEYEADRVFYEKIIVELKAAERLTTRDEGQLLNYLKATGFRVRAFDQFRQSWQTRMETHGSLISIFPLRIRFASRDFVEKTTLYL